MRVLLIDVEGVGLDFAWRCQAAGHKVKWFICKDKDGKRIPTGDGIITRVESWKPHMDWADLIWLADNVDCIEELEPYHKKGYPIIGPNMAAAKLELDRADGQKAFKAAGIDVMPGKDFSDYDSAIKYVTKENRKFACKPNGDADKALSYCGEPRSMLYMLNKWKKENGKPQEPFIIQEFQPGIEMAVGGWFGPHGWNKFFCENWEHKKLMPGNFGPNTGETGTIMHYTSDSELAEKCLKPFTKLLKSIGYCGYLDVAVIIDEEGQPWPLEFTCRPGWPAFIIQCAMHIGDPVEWMLDLVNGIDSLEVTEEVACGVICAIPDFPYGHVTRAENTGCPVHVEPKHVLRQVHPVECMMGTAPCAEDGEEPADGECLVSCGNYLAVVTGLGGTVSSAMKSCYKAVKYLEVPNNMIVRDDIGERLEDELPKLHDMGYSKDMDY